MRIRSVLKWFLLFVFLAVVVVGAIVWRMWRHSDQILYQQILTKLEQKASGWEVTLGNARFDWTNQSRIYLSNLSLKPPGASEPLLFIPASVVYLDGDLLRDHMQVLMRKLVIQDCQIHAVRFPDGSWNLDALRTLRPDPDEISFPELHLNQASVSLELQHSETSEATQFSVEQANLRCIPGGKKLYQVQGVAEIARVGKLQLQGEVDLEHGRWGLKGRINDLPAGKELLELMAEVEPDVQPKLVRVDRRLNSMCHYYKNHGDLSFEAALEEPARDSSPIQNLVVSRDQSAEPPPLISVDPLSTREVDSRKLPDFGLTGELQVEFRVGQSSREAELDYALLANLSKGELDNPLLPFPLRQLTATVYLNRHRLEVREFSAVNGQTQVKLAAHVAIHGLTTPGTFQVSVERLPISDQLKHFVKPPLQKIYDVVNPTGELSLQGTFHYDGLGHWRQENVIYEFAEGSVLFEKFQYPVHQVTGTIVPHPQENGRLLFEYRFRGLAGSRPVTLTGWNRNTDRGQQAVFHVDCQQVPIDERFIEACDAKVQKTLRSLNLHGKADVHVSVYRSPEREKGYDHTIDLDVSEAAFEYEKFPYPVRNLKGKVSFRSVDDVWLFQDMQGSHGDAIVSASGTLNLQRDPERLELSVVLSDAAVDHQLEHAMRKVVPQVWDELSPSGFVTAKSKVVWIPKWDYLDVDLPSVRLRDGTLLLKSFRYPLDRVSAQLAYNDRRVDIQKLVAWHDETKITAKGEYQLEPNDLWRLTLDELEVWDLLPDRQFRKALPDAMAAGIDTLSPDGSVTVKARTFELRGSQNNPRIPVTAAWDFDGYVAGMNVTTGLELSNVHGTFSSTGTWDGRWVIAKGTVDLDSAFCLDQQLTKIRGPFQVKQEDGKQVLIVGSEELLRGAPRTGTDSKSLTAGVIGGTLLLDARAALGDQKRDVYGHLHGDPTEYEALVELRGGRLEEYVRRNFAGSGRLQGVVNGTVSLEGTGDDPADVTGQGSVTISPAALYELPVILKIFQGLNIAAPPDQAAFDEAFLNFEIRNKQFEFSRIDLLGNALSLRGRGTVRFDQKVNLEFYSIVPKAQPVIPIIKELYQSASYGAVRVDVKGSVTQPKTKPQTNFDLTPAVRTFLSGFQPFRPLFEGMTPLPPESSNPTDDRATQIPFLPRR
jgi:hypothetical protein